MDNTVGRLQSIFPSHQFDVIIGSLMGDARLECRSIGERSPVTARFRVHHGFKQKEYVFWKYEVLKNLVLKEPREVRWKNPKRNLNESSWYFHTRSLQELGILHSLFYRDGKKILPDMILQHLNPRAMAVWFMDDGSNNGSSLTLNTHGFEKDEQITIVNFLRKTYATEATIVKDRDKWKIAIGRRYIAHFLSTIESHFAPSMTYKIDNPRNDLPIDIGRASVLSRC